MQASNKGLIIKQKGIIRGRGKSPAFLKCSRCQQKGNGNGCLQLRNHHFVKAEPKLRLLAKCPPRLKENRAAVVLDCEMVGSIMGRNVIISELVRLCAVDFLTGEVLIDTFVNPEHRVVQWRSRYSGVTAAVLNEMKAQGRVVNGWKAARAMLWQYIDKSTILIGHSLDNDLDALGMIHTRVVDTSIVTKEAVMTNCRRLWSLKKLCQEFLGRAIQAGSKGHECLEDTFATREVLLWCLQHPDQLIYWASCEKDIMAKEEEKRAAEREKREKEKAAKEKERKTTEAGESSILEESYSESDATSLDSFSGHSYGILV
jgi:DNA polymerase III epsilon subunit-like protein